ncbi:MAG TPA: hypothetical protein VFR73_19070 [Hyphomicrobiaceae bacterium]|nr:hypothetical protein [Hyphomicrobiaceae bacterium]
MMKPMLIVLAVLATAKVLHHEYLFRTSTRDVIIQAYRERAVLACQRDALGTMLGVSPQAWSTPNSITLAIGKRNLDVHLWQVDHKNWSARYRNPYLFISAGQRSTAVTCEYDIVNASAFVYR